MMLDVRDVTVSYGPFLAVDRAGLQVDAGEIVGLAGTNGAGKSTLFAAIAGQIAADGGTMVFDGQNIANHPAYQRARLGLCRTFQVPREFGRLSVLENLLVAAPCDRMETMLSAWFARGAMGRQTARLTEQADEILDMLGVLKLRDQPAAGLSGGQKKLLELARVLMHRPRLILLDEPFAGVNPVRIGEVMDIFRRLKENGIALLIVEHHLQALKALSSRLYVMDQGKVIAHGDPVEVLGSKTVQDAYMGGVL
ncbi:MAG: ABC transporter ATP-binding protein [Castellaniella sp.]|nr:ABC transporter ATP-binding protein [Castellaniella sp.]